MVVLIDANILITYITDRDDPYHDAAVTVMRMCADGTLEGCMAFHTLSIIWYVLRKWPDSERRKWLHDICSILTVVCAGQQEVMEAVERKEFRDFEDCLQDVCAVAGKADYIVTANIKDYIYAKVKAISPDALLRQLGDE